MPPGGGTSAATVAWPFIVGASSSSASGSTITSAAAWAIRLKGDESVARLVSLLSSSSNVYVPDILGSPG